MTAARDQSDLERAIKAARASKGKTAALDPLVRRITAWQEAGLKVVMNRCPKIEYGRLSGEIGWMGVNRRLIDNRKPLLFGKGGALKRGS